MTTTERIQPHMLNNDDLYKKTWKALLIGGIALIALYLYFVSGIIFHIVERKKTANDVRVLTSHIGEMEHQYLGLSENVNMETAFARGFSEDNKPLFITKETVSIRDPLFP